MSFNIKKVSRYAKMFRPEVEHWWQAFLIGWLVAKAPENLNERELEWPWVINEAEKLAEDRKLRLLDIGSYNTPLPEKLAACGHYVTALDSNVPQVEADKNINLVTSDIRLASFKSDSFDLVTCVSTLEHIGVRGRYGVQISDEDGDRKAMKEIARILKPEGVALITIPYGKYSLLPVNRCYNSGQKDLLFKGFVIEKKQFFSFSPESTWQSCSEKEAENVNWLLSPWYALACFKLRNKRVN